MRARGWVAAVAVALSAFTGLVGQVAYAAPAQVPPYERAEFGDGWLDLDGDGCDTRQEILVRDLVDERLDRDGCRVLTGTLHDPYTGRTITFERGPDTSDDVQIDHVVPLAYAWRAGAWAWTDAQREGFANDPANLQATDGPTNNRKGDDGPSLWLPPSPVVHCDYAARWVQVLQAYQLPATPADAAALDDLTASCPAR